MKPASVAPRASWVIAAMSGVALGAGAPAGPAGTWRAALGNETLSLQVTPSGANAWRGVLDDGHERYALSGAIDGASLTGRTAADSTLAIAIEARQQDDAMQALLSIGGVPLQVQWARTSAAASMGNAAANGAAGAAKSAAPVATSGRAHDPAVVGVWRREQNYNSGYGGGGYSSNSTLAFNADGTLSDLGSQTVIGGTGYSGQASGAGTGIVAGLRWYTENSGLYLVQGEAAAAQTVRLGRYYIERGAMLVTADNGSKALYYRQ